MSRPTRVHHLDVDGEDGVRPGGVRVHLGGSRGPVLPALSHHGLALRGVTHSMQGDVLHINSSVWVLFQLQLLLDVLAQEVSDLLVVDL